MIILACSANCQRFFEGGPPISNVYTRWLKDAGGRGGLNEYPTTEAMPTYTRCYPSFRGLHNPKMFVDISCLLVRLVTPVSSTPGPTLAFFFFFFPKLKARPSSIVPRASFASAPTSTAPAPVKLAPRTPPPTR